MTGNRIVCDTAAGWHALSLRRACLCTISPLRTPFEDSGRATRRATRRTDAISRTLIMLVCVLLALGAGLGLIMAPARAADDGWGTVEGQVVFGGDTIPEPKPIDVSNNIDRQHCLSQGPLVS